MEANEIMAENKQISLYEKRVSKGIENFLSLLREVEQQHSISVTVEQDSNDETQDMLHIIELEKVKQEEVNTLYNKLKEARIKRRTAKDYVLQTTPVISWIEENKNVIKSLEKLLGEVRKAERYSHNKIFTPKTRISEEIFNTDDTEEIIPLF